MTIQHSEMKKSVVLGGKEKKVKSVSVWIISNGQKYVFDRVAHCVNGNVDLGQLRDDEVLLAPGVIYRTAIEE
ncbi:hypothetical protein [Vibrio vulnificus]|uniref:hypothetical protein n=1 Tax=Vibrio vulnificus TaxID=672 RepID=UPI00102AA3FB|nr:hypothetical protein [Vibrio vulnificus]RZR42440.1 hypothetical protein D8T58_19185 [Vibrio vulnificus]